MGTRPNAFCNSYLTLGVGGDYNIWNERQLDVYVDPPGFYTAALGSGAGFVAQGHVGWGVPICCLAYIGAQIGYHAFFGDGAYFLTHDIVEFTELKKRQGVYATPGVLLSFPASSPT